MKVVNEALKKYALDDKTLNEEMDESDLLLLDKHELIYLVGELRSRLGSILSTKQMDTVKVGKFIEHSDDIISEFVCKDKLECMKAKLSGDLKQMEQHQKCKTKIEDVIDMKPTGEMKLITPTMLKSNLDISLSQFVSNMIIEEKKLEIEEFEMLHHSTEYGTAKIYLQYMLQKLNRSEKISYNHYATESIRALAINKVVKIKYWDVKVTVGDMTAHSRFKYLTTQEAELCACDALIVKYNLMKLIKGVVSNKSDSVD